MLSPLFNILSATVLYTIVLLDAASSVEINVPAGITIERLLFINPKAPELV